jgi:flavin-dependent dehydrogenase
VYDAIIVGARCAGAPLATHLARAGLRVVVVEADRLPSDQPASTHLIHPAGMGYLDDLGVGEAVRALAPPIHAYHFGWDGAVARCTAGASRAARCLRREKLDALLQDAAARAGAEIRDRSRVTKVAIDGRRASVDVVTAGRTERLTAKIVIGADGHRSTIARLVGAREYVGYDAPRAAYWAYWSQPAGWDPGVMYQGVEGDDVRFVLPTDEDLLLVGTAPRIQRARTWRKAHVAAYLADIRTGTVIAPLLADAQPVDRVVGVVGLRFFLRAAVGRGWALVGDAGRHTDFLVARGITEALRDARSLATAIVDGSDTALERYWRRRDLDSVGSLRVGEDLGAAGAGSHLERALFIRLATAPAVAQRLLAVALARSVPYPILPPAAVLRWVFSAAIRGEVGLIGPLLARTWRTLAVGAERAGYARRLRKVARARPG